MFKYVSCVQSRSKLFHIYLEQRSWGDSCTYPYTTYVYVGRDT